MIYRYVSLLAASTFYLTVVGATAFLSPHHAERGCLGRAPLRKARPLVTMTTTETESAAETPSSAFGDVPVFWINLDRSTARRAQMEAQFAAHGVRHTRVRAVDGRTLFADESSPGARAARDRCVELPPGGAAELENSPGELGCTLSHVLCCVAALRAGHERALVMEDDIHLDYVGRWATSLDEVAAAAPGDWDVLQARAAVFLDLLFFRSKTMGRERLGL